MFNLLFGVLLVFSHLFSHMRDICKSNRLAGATLVAPVVNYWWSGFPANLSKEAYQQQLPQDQWAFRVSHYAPWLTYWWNTQKWFHSSSIIAHSTDILSSEDKKLWPKIISTMNHVVCISLCLKVPCTFCCLSSLIIICCTFCCEIRSKKLSFHLYLSCD